LFKALQPSSNKMVVVKRLSRKEPPSRIREEIEAGIRLRNVEGVPQFLYSHEDSQYTWLIMDLADGSDLLTWMERADFVPMNEEHCRSIAFQLLITMSSIHDAGVAHKDLKLENIVMSPEGVVSIIDFGLAFNFDGNAICTDCAGSIEYASPEILLSGEPFSATKADVWSLGVTIFALLYGSFPFGFDDRILNEMLTQRKHPEVIFPRSIQISSAARDILRRMLDINPQRRWDIEKLLKHPWFSLQT